MIRLHFKPILQALKGQGEQGWDTDCPPLPPGYSHAPHPQSLSQLPLTKTPPCAPAFKFLIRHAYLYILLVYNCQENIWVDEMKFDNLIMGFVGTIDTFSLQKENHCYYNFFRESYNQSFPEGGLIDFGIEQ